MSENSDVTSSRSRLETPTTFGRIAQVVSFGANLAVMVGILFAFEQIRQANRIQRCQVSMAAIESTRSPAFLEAFGKLRDAYAEDPTMPSSDRLRGDLYYVLNIYDNMAILCLRGIAD